MRLAAASLRQPVCHAVQVRLPCCPFASHSCPSRPACLQYAQQEGSSMSLDEAIATQQCECPPGCLCSAAGPIYSGTSPDVGAFLHPAMPPALPSPLIQT